jgi:hypothetical protein
MPIALSPGSREPDAGGQGQEDQQLVTYAVVDAQTGSMISSHGSFDAARAEAAQSAHDHPEQVSIYVFDDTGYVAGQCAGSQDRG